MAFIKKLPIFTSLRVSVSSIDTLYCPKEYYVILCRGDQVGRPILNEQIANEMVDWLNTVDYFSLLEDRQVKRNNNDNKI